MTDCKNPMPNISNDVDTWPVGDWLWQFARAIAFAEGYNTPNGIACINNNPGCIPDDFKMHGGVPDGWRHVTHYSTAWDGWCALRNHLYRIMTGHSSIVTPQSTLEDMAHVWSSNPGLWASCVSTHLALKPQDKLYKLLESPRL